MGWWGFGVTEGDEPCDLQTFILDTIVSGEMADALDEAAEGDPVVYDRMRHELHAHITKQLNDEAIVTSLFDQSAVTLTDGCYDDENIKQQVIAAVVMEHGGVLSLANKQKVFDAIKNDEWSVTSDNRKTALEEFRTAVLNYTGEAVQSPDKGLMQTIMEAPKDGGLINK